MRTNSYITLWHLSEDGSSYTRHFYKAGVFWEDRLSKAGMRQNSNHSGSRADVRIPMVENSNAELGDYVRLGKCYDAAPDRICDLKVTRVTKNYLGANPHIRLFCGRASERS